MTFVIITYSPQHLAAEPESLQPSVRAFASVVSDPDHKVCQAALLHPEGGMLLKPEA